MNRTGSGDQPPGRRRRAASSGPGRLRQRVTGSPLLARAQGVRLVWGLDLRAAARERSTWIGLGTWAALVYGLLALALASSGGSSGTGAGSLVHSLIAACALTGALVLAPYLGADALSRGRGTGLLGMLRITGLSARELSWGFYAATLTRIAVLLLVTFPPLITGFALGGCDASGLFLSVVVIAAVWVTLAGAAQGMAAAAATRAGALAAGYGVAAALTIAPPLLFAFALPATSQEVTAKVSVLAGTHGTARSAGSPSCTTIRAQRTRTRPDRIWWLLAPEPFVILADAAPGQVSGPAGFDPLSALRDAVRSARLTPPEEPVITECPLASAAAAGAGPSGNSRAELEQVLPAWPAGLAVLGAAGTGGIATATRRLRAPGALPIGGRHRA